MEVLDRKISDDTSGPLLDCEYGSINFRDAFFCGGGVHNKIFHQLVYSLVKLHVHEDSMYYHATSGIDFHNLF